MRRKRLKYTLCKRCEYYIAASKPKKGRFFKLLISVVILHGMACVSMSYALAWSEHAQVVEGVSSTIITEIIAPIIVYGFTKTIENIFQKNELKFSKPITQEQYMSDETEKECEVAPVQLEGEEL